MDNYYIKIDIEGTKADGTYGQVTHIASKNPTEQEIQAIAEKSARDYVELVGTINNVTVLDSFPLSSHPSHSSNKK